MSSSNNRKLTLSENDECYTHDKVWEDIWKYIPNCDVVFEPFYGASHGDGWMIVVYLIMFWAGKG